LSACSPSTPRYAAAVANVAGFRRRFEVSERTVRGDLALMRERLNAPLEHDRTHSVDYQSNRFTKVTLNYSVLLR